MNAFGETETIDWEGQKGVKVNVGDGHNAARLSFWIDTIEKDDPRLFTALDGCFHNLMVTGAGKLESRVPDVAYSDDKTYCYLKFNAYQVHIKLGDEGITIDVWLICDADAEQVIDSTYLYWDEVYGREEMEA